MILVARLVRLAYGLCRGQFAALPMFEMCQRFVRHPVP
ncbi:hypothetical protein [Azospirillum palustre]